MLTSGLLILFFACSVNAAKYDNVPYDEVLKIATEQKDPVALNELGYRYLNGVDGVDKDYVKAREWFDKAIAQGSGTAESNVGTMYDKGNGVEQDYAKAKEWYEKGVAKNDKYAQLNLGGMYKEGRGVEKDPLKAKELLEKSAEQGLSYAQSFLGDMYFFGQGIKKDAIKARYWYEKAAEQGIPEAQFNLAVMYENGMADLKKDHDKAMDLFEKACVGGVEHPICQ